MHQAFSDHSTRLAIVTNLPAPYRDDIFSELQRRLDTRIFLLADDEPGRGWARRDVPYRYSRVPALAIRGERPRYLPLPTWLFRQGFILVGGFGAPALLTALIRPKSTLIWSEATHFTEAGRGTRRIRLRRWLISRSRAVVAVGEASTKYLSSLGARRIVVLPNVTSEPVDGSVESDIPETSEIILAHVGDWSLRKGADKVTDVFHTLSRTSGVPVTLVVAGNVIDVPLPEGVDYLGYLPHDQVWQQLRDRSAAFLLLLSRSDPWGFVVPEAMSRGMLPIVSMCVGCARDLVSPIQPRLVVNCASEAADVILALHMNPDARKSLVAQTRALARLRTSHWAADVFCADLKTL